MAKRRKDGSVNHPSGLVVQKADPRRSRPLQWLWHRRLLVGSINLLVGEEGIGKGNLTAWIIARVTKGDLSGNLKDKPGKVAIIGDEDDFDDVWTPRLKAAGADLDRAKGMVTFIKAGPSGGALNLLTDHQSLRQFIEEEQIALVYFDQLLDNLGVTNSWHDKQVRDALAPLRAVVRDTKCTALGSLHPNKRAGSFRDRISGTPAFNTLSRSSLLVGPHPHDPNTRAVVRGKANYGKEPRSFEFHIEGRSLKRGRGRAPLKTSRIADYRYGLLTKDDVLDAYDQRRGADRSAAGRARQFITEIVADGEPHLAKPIQEKLKKQGISTKLSSSAAKDLGLTKWQDGFQGPWYWQDEQVERGAD